MNTVSHRGRPVQFGAEKEYNLKSLKAGKGRLAETSASRFQASVLGAEVPGDLLVEGQTMPAGEVSWDQLNDAGKAKYALRHRETKGGFPEITPDRGADYGKVDFEKNGWVELISNKFDDLPGLKSFLDTYGWGHVHVSFARGAPPEKQQEMLSWIALSNVWSFVNALEERGASGNGEEAWRFSIKGLSLPTEEHLDRYAEMLAGKNKVATAFAKHLVVNLRGNGKQYGERDRIGIEVRGGYSGEKKMMVDSLLNGLTEEGGALGTFGSKPFAWGSNDFRLVRLGADVRRSTKRSILQVKSLPSDFGKMMAEHIESEGAGDLKPADADRLQRFVAGAKLTEKGAARLDAFDQRAAVPLLKYEALPFLDDAEKARAVEARGHFITELAALEKTGVGGLEAGEKIAQLITSWAKRARLAAPLGRYMTGGRDFL